MMQTTIPGRRTRGYTIRLYREAERRFAVSFRRRSHGKVDVGRVRVDWRRV